MVRVKTRVQNGIGFGIGLILRLRLELEFEPELGVMLNRRVLLIGLWFRADRAEKRNEVVE